jgi:dGTPase
MDWADDVTYGVHDVEDFFRAGMLPLDRLVLKDDEVERDRFVSWMASREAHKPNGLSRADIEATLDPFRIGVPGPFRGTRSDRAALRTFTSLLINEFVQCVEVSWDGEEPKLAIESELRARIAVLKALTTYYVIESPAVLAQRYGQRRVVRTLSEIFYQAATDKHREDLAIFPMIFRERLELIDHDDRPEIKRLIADLIASMSEGQLLDAFAKLTGQTQGSVVDPIL